MKNKNNTKTFGDKKKNEKCELIFCFFGTQRELRFFFFGQRIDLSIIVGNMTPEKATQMDHNHGPTVNFRFGPCYINYESQLI